MTQTATDTYRITGGNALHGRVRIGGSKNGADYAMAAALLTADDVVLHNIPDIGDVRQMEEILEHLGATIERLGQDAIRINCENLSGWEVPASLAARLRASFLVMGPLLARTGRASCPPPGGDAIGIRPLDVHLEGATELAGTEHRIIPDRLEAGTFALAGARTGGDIELEEAVPEHLDALIWKMQESGVEVRPTDAGIRVIGDGQYRAVNAQA